MKRDPLDGLAEEIQRHIEAEILDNLDRGMAPAEARRAALRKFGSISAVQEGTYAVWHRVWLEQLLRDLRYCVRALRRSPGFAITVMLTLGIAIGMNTGVFSVVGAVVLRPLPYPVADRLVWLASYSTDYVSDHDTLVSRDDYSNWKDQSQTIESAAAYGNQDLTVMYRGQPSEERIASITGDFWNLTGAQAALGTLFHEGAPHAMVLSHAFFERRFNADPRILGRTVSINGFPFTIVGVLPQRFQFLLPQQYSTGDLTRDIDAYIAFPPSVMYMPVGPYTAWEPIVKQVGPTPYYVCVLGRLRSGVTLDAARAEMNSFYSRQMRERHSSEQVFTLHRAWRMKMLRDKISGNARRALAVLMAAGGFVLLIACANIANLLLSRATVRQREIAIRAALGAGRLRVARLFLSESLLLAIAGGVIGLGLAWCAISLMVRFWPQAIPRLTEARLDPLVLLFSFFAACFTGCLFGLAPAVMVWRGNLNDVLKDGGQTMGTSRRLNIRSLLVAIEVCLAIVLLTGAGLMIKSFWRMNQNPPGFNPASILTLRVSLTGNSYDTWPAQQAYIHELLGRLRSAPGVEAAGLSSAALHTTVKVAGLPSESSQQTFASIRAVSAGYLRAMGTPLLKGRWLSDGELLDDVIVNESFARSLSPGGDVIGRHIGGGYLDGTIAGVVADFKYSQLDAEPMPEIYTSYELAPLTTPMTVALYVRMADGARPDTNEIQKMVAAIDRTQPVYDVQTLEQELSDSIAPRRFNLFLIGVFAAAAFLMAALGIYGVVAYSVAQRTREIGVRMALGATRSDVVRMVVSRMLLVALAGVLFGVCASLVLTSLMQSLLYGVSSHDPLTIGGVALVLLLTALLACLRPAIRAAFVNPVTALRES